MAFEYTPYRNPYIGTIADLMARGEDAKAKALIDVASAQARAAEAKGQIYGNAISSIGQDISKSLRDYNSSAAKQQREMDQAQAILKARGLETRQDERMRVNPGNFQAGRPYEVFTDAPVEGLADRAFGGIDFRGNLNPSVRTDATFRMVDGEPIEVPAESFSGLPSAISRSNVFGGQPETAPSDGLSRSMAGVLGQTETRTSLPTGRKASLESYKTAPVGRYTTEQGMYDVKTAYNDLIQAGISPTVAGGLAGQGQQANAIFAAFDKQKEDLAKTEVAMRGSIANVVLNTYKANPSVPIEDILQSVMGPAGNRIPAQDLEDFQVAMFGKPPQQQIQMLQSLVKQWDAQGPRQVVNPGDYVMGASGNATQMGPTPVSPAAQELAQNMSDWKDSGSKLPFDQWLSAGRRAETKVTPEELSLDAFAKSRGLPDRSKMTNVDFDAYAKSKNLRNDDPQVALLRSLAIAAAEDKAETTLINRTATETFNKLPLNIQGAVNTISLKFTPETRKNFVRQIADAPDEERRLQLLRASVIPTGEAGTRYVARQATIDALSDIQDTLAVLRKTITKSEGPISGNIQKIANTFGLSVNPEYQKLGTHLKNALINYRRGITGAAFSAQESKDYSALFSNFSNTEKLTDSILFGFKDALEGDIISNYTTLLGGDEATARILASRPATKAKLY